MVSASSLLLLPSSVRDLASCVVADVAACTTPASTLISSSSSSGSTSSLSVTVSYRATAILPGRHLRLTWTRSPLGPTLSFYPSASSPAVHLRRRKGTRSVSLDDFESGVGDGAGTGPGSCSQVVVFWDLTAARYDASPEPHSGYYFVAVAGDEVVLAVGDLAAEFVEDKFPEAAAAALSLPVARRERVVAPDQAAMHTARRVRFAEGGPEHEVSVGCSGGGAEEELWVSVDGKRAVQARQPRLNFRGNQTVFVDGDPVDVMWDLHGWWFRKPPVGCAVVMLRARSALESRLWLEEEEAAAAPGFSLVVQAFKSRFDDLSSAHR
ncbi:uncharacterized protein LOC124699209 [Lolium rigidum]|uniref:uncharacterized protein LOC124699209 n=1 Tax=Lolium rigidum TaxID=89674 RepID=UPI001F5CE68F|nr:uncharacterized protein LOC124699209 [Lolium rigidum]